MMPTYNPPCSRWPWAEWHDALGLWWAQCAHTKVAPVCAGSHRDLRVRERESLADAVVTMPESFWALCDESGAWGCAEDNELGG